MARDTIPTPLAMQQHGGAPKNTALPPAGNSIDQAAKRDSVSAPVEAKAESKAGSSKTA